MRSKVRVTVVGGTCQDDIHESGDSFVVDELTPPGICLGAFGSVLAYVVGLRYGANYDWEGEDGVCTIHCPDPDGIIMKLERINE